MFRASLLGGSVKRNFWSVLATTSNYNGPAPTAMTIGLARLKLRKARVAFLCSRSLALSLTVPHADAGPARRATAPTSQDLQCRVFIRPGTVHVFFFMTSPSRVCQVYECMVRGIAVMRRRADSYVNATQILKVAGVDKGRRTKILEKEILPGKHEIVQGGYGKYQGTWSVKPSV